MGSHSLRPPAAERSAQSSESPAKANHLVITAGVLNEEAGGAVSQREECERQAWQLSRETPAPLEGQPAESLRYSPS